MAVTKKEKNTDPAVLERMAKARAARGKSKKQDAFPEIVEAIGIAHCRNAKWITAELNHEIIKVRLAKYIKDPKRKTISCRKIEEPNFYEQIL